MMKALYLGMLAVLLSIFVGCSANTDEESKPDLIVQPQLDALEKAKQLEGKVKVSAEEQRKELQERGL